MKKTLLTVLFCSCALLQTIAQSTSRYATFVKGQAQTELPTLKNVASTADGSASEENTVPSANAPITEQPAGHEQMVLWNGKGFVNYGWGPNEQDIVDGISTIVYGEDGCIYIKDCVVGLSQGTWLKLDKVNDTTYVAHKQPVATLYMENGEEVSVYIQNMKYKYIGGEMMGTYEPAANTDLTYKVKDGVISLQTTEYTTVEADGMTEQMPNIAGLSDNAGEWIFFGDWEDSWSEFKDKPVIVPADITLKKYVVEGPKGKSADEGGTSPFIISAGFKGDKVYFTDLPTSSEDRQLAIEGTLKDGKVTIPCGQLNAIDAYIGALFYTYRLTTIATYYPEWDETYYDFALVEGEDIVLNYDAEKDIFAYADTFAIVKGKGGDYVNPIVTFGNCTISPFVPSQQRPKNPIMGSFYPVEEDYYGYLSFTIPNEDIDGNFIDYANLSWCLYTEVDGKVEPWTFYADEYNLEADMQTIPLGFSNNAGIYCYDNNPSIDIFVADINNWGVQSIYTIGDKVFKSDIVWLEENEATGIETVGQNIGKDAKTQIFDLSGRQVLRPSHGIYVISSRQADGSVKTRKVVLK